VDRLIDVFPHYQQGQIRAQLSMSLLLIISQRLISRMDRKGLTVCVEILVANSAVSHCIREEKTHQIYTVMETHAKDGMQTMDQALKELYLRGLINYEDCRNRMRNPTTLDKLETKVL
jgi:twitching motility protein PilT